MSQAMEQFTTTATPTGAHDRDTAASSRRSALRFGGLAALAGLVVPVIGGAAAAAAPNGADAELLAICAAFQRDHALMAQIDAEQIEATDDDVSVLGDRIQNAIIRAAELPAHTAAGRCAKAAIVQARLPDDVCVYALTEDSAVIRLTLSLARDLTGRPHVPYARRPDMNAKVKGIAAQIAALANTMEG